MKNFLIKLKSFEPTAKQLAPAVTRIGLAAVVIWFGAAQLFSPSSWTGMVPTWAVFILNMTPEQIVHLNGYFEILAGALLAIGIFTRCLSFVLALHLFLITLNLGLSPSGVRDFGLSFALFSVALYGADKYSFESKE